MKWLVRLLAFPLLIATCTGDNIVYVRVHRPMIDAHLGLAPATEADRIRITRSLFQKGGCPQIIEQSVPQQDFPNLICLLPGSEPGTIVVGASSDYAPDDPTGWNTLVMLPLLVESLAPIPHRFTIAIAAFTGRDHHLRGASWYVEHLSDDQRKSMRAMIDLDNLGRTPAVYAMAQSNRDLTVWLDVAAHSLQLLPPTQLDPSTFALPMQNGQPAIKNEDLLANAAPFVRQQIPAITVQSAGAAAIPALQRAAAIPGDVTGKDFNPDTYENTYRLLAVYLLYLDRNLGRPLIEPGLYTGRIIDTAGLFPSSPIDLGVQINSFTTPEQLNRFEQILEKGQDALADALSNENDQGTFRFGLNLALGAKLITVQTSGATSQLLLVTSRFKARGATAHNYRFTVIKLKLERDGRGEGEYYSTAKLRFNKKHELEVEDFGSKPDPVVQVRFEPPAKAAPGTAVAEVAAPQPAAPTAARPAPPATATVASAAAGTPSAAPKDGAVFKTKAQLVLLDVTVTDSDGHPVRGLKQSDFTVQEDGKPQELSAFEAHFPPPQPTIVVAAAAPVLPPHTYSNRVTLPSEETLNILLLDLLNTPVLDQAYARKQTIQFLKALPPGKRLGMYVLSQKNLVMVQEFTGDSATLVAAAEKILNDKSILVTTEAERQSFLGSTESVGRLAAPAIPAAAGAGPGLASSTMDLGSAKSRERTNDTMEAQRTGQRIGYTLDAMTGLAHSVAGYPGRKNLIWLSGSFPISLRPKESIGTSNASSVTGLSVSENYDSSVREVSRALAGARIAVYPIDVRGVATSGVDITVGASESASFTGTDTPGAYGANLNQQSSTRFDERSSMVEVAQETGGQILAGNDIRGAIGRGLDNGATYYTLAYIPAKDDSDPAFRKVKVNLNRSGLKLSYRPGYFPQRKPSTDAPKAHPLITAMQPGMLPSTGIPLTVVILPPDSSSSKTRIDYRIDISPVDFAETADHRKRAVLDCIAVAFSKEGNPVGQVSNTIDVSLPPAEYEGALHDGFAVHQDLDLPAGAYILRLGVMDHASQKIGTLDAPLAVTAVAAAK